MLMCNIACQAVDYAIQSLNRSLLERFRRSISSGRGASPFCAISISNWVRSRSVRSFQAKGYQYKLNQMSKSERIFLYLLLKLAIGDALSHLSVHSG